MEHARAALPDEAVGLLAGAKGKITAVIPLPNIAPTGQFHADPHAQYQAERQLQRDGTQLLAIYHSHPAGGTQLSPLDIKFATARRCLHMVIALDPARPGQETAAAYDLETNKACTVAIDIT